MFDAFTRAQQAACEAVVTRLRAARQLIGRLLLDPLVQHRWGLRLQSWDQAFASFDEELLRYLRAARQGMFNPALFATLLSRAQQLTGGFIAFLTESSLMAPKEVQALESQMAVPIGEHKLPPLPYSYDALEPHIDAATMRIHHDRHHRSYVEGLNKAEKKMAEARRTGDFDLIRHWEREAAFNGAGHYLHTLFWTVMSPEGGGKPDGALLEAITAAFGSYDGFKQHFSAAAEKVEGGGWAILVWSPRSGRLEILQAEKHQNLSQWDVIPLLPLDVWEHAYYLKYQDERKKYIDAWWNVVNWPEVARRFEKARTVMWEPY